MPPSSPEQAPVRRVPSPEAPTQSRSEVGSEKGEREATRERVNGAGVGDTPPPAASTPHAPPSSGVPVAGDQSSAMIQLDDTPLVAADEDLIEKAWVDKAKKIVSETKDDPYIQEQAVSRLQADYMQKRYGRSVRLPEE